MNQVSTRNVTASGNKIISTGGIEAAGLNIRGPYSMLVDSHIEDNVGMGPGSMYGAGVRVTGSERSIWKNVTIERNLFIINSLGTLEALGAGVHVDGRGLSLHGCIIQGNQLLLGSAGAGDIVTIRGGGVFSNAELILEDCNVTFNHITAEPTNGVTIVGGGGGVYEAWSSTGISNITRTTLRGNTVTLGGSCDESSIAEGGGGRWRPQTYIQNCLCSADSILD